ncbi:DUF86 domain-containing protein [Heliorestis acidaminivorans]|uniref:DUF86 domain-containing protein n=1 Tax=Heliorestis acidaminivorans TaxID=553427 RepID=A0A6I0EXF2_9FIRM|nr:DUF86 domain-containing protein [Heliorestis acidaminivorans]KAB2952960.1 DUF86 domain-containing protein [Heliorestis acidaminivorans]
MTLIEKEIIFEKLIILKGYCDELQTISEQLSEENYRKNIIYKRAVERIIQLIVEVATDINNMLLKAMKKGPTVGYFSSFIELGEAKVLPIEFATKIAPSTGLHNIIVHEYQKIDDHIVYRSIQDVLTYYKEYVRYIYQYIGM